MKLAALVLLAVSASLAQTPISAPPWRIIPDGTFQSAGTHGVTTTSLRLNPQTLARPLCNVSRRGTFWVIYSASGFADTLQLCSKGADDTYSWAAVGSTGGGGGGGGGTPADSMTWNGSAMIWNGVYMTWN